MTTECKKYRLNKVAEVFTGYQTRGRLRFLDKGRYPLIQTSDISLLGVVDVTSCQRIDPDANPDPYILQKDDILLQARGSSHRPYYLKEVPENALCTNTFMVIRCTYELIKPRFLAWWMKQSCTRDYLAKQTSGSHVPFLSKKVIEAIDVCLPDMVTQRNIAELDELWERQIVLMSQLQIKHDKRMQAYFTKIQTELLNASK